MLRRSCDLSALQQEEDNDADDDHRPTDTCYVCWQSWLSRPTGCSELMSRPPRSCHVVCLQCFLCLYDDA